MSADIWLEDAEGNALVFGEDETIPMRASAKVFGNAFNLTYNLTPMLRIAGMDPWRDFIGLPASVAGQRWAKVLDALSADPAMYKAMNPANGWGDYDGAVKVLTALVEACADYPDAKIGGWL